MKFTEWYKINRPKLVSISTLFFLPAKWKRVVKALIGFIDELVEKEVYVLTSAKINEV